MSAEMDANGPLISPVMSPINDYVVLSQDGNASRIEGGDQFWRLSEADLDAVGRQWLLAEFIFDTDWPNWEMHPEADELVYVLSGEANILLESERGIELVHVVAPALVRVPRGIWHTAKIIQSSRFLHMTMGAGTLVRPA